MDIFPGLFFLYFNRFREIKSIMDEKYPVYGKSVAIPAGVLILVGLFFASRYNYLLFHSLAEIFSIIVACGIFMVTWNSRSFIENHYFLYLGLAYFFIAVIDFIHFLAYEGMGVFEGSGGNLAAQLWIVARYMESLALLIAPAFIRKKINLKCISISYIIMVSLILLAIFCWEVFPVCFVEGQGLTAFKKISEYIISFILLVSIALLFKNRSEFDEEVFLLLVFSIALTIASELAFTFYIHVYGLSNLIGHYLKIISFFLIYKAVIETGIVKPQTLLFRDLKESESKLKRVSERLEKKVEERTMEIRRISYDLLSAQEEERRRVALELHDDLGQSLSAIKFKIEESLHGLRKEPESKCAEILEPIVPMVQEIVNSIRRIQKNLRPPSLDDLGILPTISWFCREFETTYSGIKILKNFDVEEGDIPEPLKIVIFRVIQEALNNTAKHSRAEEVNISIILVKGILKLVISDNGIGFNLKEFISLNDDNKGIGLSGMKERTDLSGGRFSVSSRKRIGTTIKSEWNLDHLK
jgi:signal transduction histidine kinase